MGLYPIDCKGCGQPFMWFSGDMSQLCSNCKPPFEGKLEPVIQPSSRWRAYRVGIGLGVLILPYVFLSLFAKDMIVSIGILSYVAVGVTFLFL